MLHAFGLSRRESSLGESTILRNGTARFFRTHVFGARARVLGLSCCLLSLPAAAGAVEPPVDGTDVARWELRSVVTTLDFHGAALAGFGLELTKLRPTVSDPPQHPLSVARPSAVGFAAVDPVADGGLAIVRNGRFGGFAGGALRHRGGFALRLGERSVDFLPLVVRPGVRPYEMEILGADGEPLLVATHAHYAVDRRAARVQFFNADVRVLPALARALGNEHLAGVPLGSMAVEASVIVGREPMAATPLGTAPPPCGDWSGEVDVALTDIDALAQSARSGGRVVVTPSVWLENVGTANVPWIRQFGTPTGPYANDQHPYLVWQLLREKDGILAPVGRSDVKHAFYTVNYGCDSGACDPAAGNILGIGCADVYSSATNVSNRRLAPRAEVNAATGVWDHCDVPSAGTPSHLDANGDCVEDSTSGPPGENVFTHGMSVLETDLGVAGARYFIEAWYLVRDDVDIFNSMGHRETTPTFGGTSWTFSLDAFPYTDGPTVNAWVDPDPPGANASNEVLDTGAGHVQLAARVTELGGGQRRFAWALQNHDFDRQIASLHLPFDASHGIVATGFADGDESAANDWVAVADATGVTWTAPVDPGENEPRGELDWGTLYAFWIDTVQPPAAQPHPLTLAPYEPGAPAQLELAALLPGGLFSDDLESGTASAWSQVEPVP